MGVQSGGQTPESKPGGKKSIDDCPTCGAPVSPFITKCPFCNADVKKRSWWRAKKLRARSRIRRVKDGTGRVTRASKKAAEQSRLSTQTPYAVGFLILANIFTYLAFDVRGDLFTDPGAFAVDAVRNGEWERLITYQFLHTGILELLFGLILLVIFAIMVEQRYGHFMALGIYLLSGIGGGLLAIAVNSGGVTAGSLVSTLGLMGAWLVAIYRPLPEDRQYPMPAALLIVSAIFLLGLLQDGIDVWTLVGGLVTGVVIAATAELIRWRRVV